MTDKTAPEILEAYIQDIVSQELTETQLQDAKELDEARLLGLIRHRAILQVVADRAQDVRNELRYGEIETNVTPEYSRHYEAKSVAIHLEDFEGFTGYIGWTFWYGGGKYGETELIDWVSSAYFLNLVEEREVVTIVRTFEKGQ